MIRSLCFDDVEMRMDQVFALADGLGAGQSAIRIAHDLILQFVEGETVTIPRTADEWQLPRHLHRTDAAGQLHVALRSLFGAIRSQY